MNFERMLLSNTVLIPLALSVLIAIALAFLPLAGVLGFEYSALTGFILSFISVFISAELIDRDYKTFSGRRLSDRVSAVFLVNFVLLLAVFAVGLISSLLKGDCNIKEGIIFYFLITGVTVFFSASLGVLTGFIFRARGFLIGALVIIATIVYSLLTLYYEPSLFVYNPMFGFFPGPIYDEVLPVTSTLLAYRAVTVLWGLLFLTVLSIANGLGYSRVGVWDAVKLLAIVSALIFTHAFRSELGISFPRSYITEKVLPASVETDHFIIYYDPGSPGARQIDLITEDHEWRYRELAGFLKVDSADKIRSYIYPDIDTRKRVVGAGETTIANPIHKEIHLVYDAYPHPVLKHELVHVMAADFGSRLLKISPKIGLLEGLAVAADWSGEEYTPHQWSKAIIEMGKAPDIESITGLGFWYAPASVSYTLMGSFSRYLIDTYGMENFKKAYGSGDFSVYGKSEKDLIAEWRAFLETVRIPRETRAIAEARFGDPGLFGSVCVRKVAALKSKAFRYYADENYYKAASLFSDALSYNANDPVSLTGLAYSDYYLGKYGEASEPAGSTEGLTGVDRAILSNIKGNSLWQEGDSEGALEIFSALREKYLPSDLRRELDVKIPAINEGGLAEKGVREFFSTRDRAIQAISLEEAVMDAPGYSPAYYLLGRLLFNGGYYGKAVPYLEMARYLGLPSEELERENLRLLGTSLYASGDAANAALVFESLGSEAGSGVYADYSADFLGRIGSGRK